MYEVIKNNKSTGTDDIFYRLLTKIWISEKISNEWKVSFICPLNKKDYRSDCKNYRCMTLLSVAYNILPCECNCKRISTRQQVFS
uniref:Uncharacterized protein n=1 Tax=Megaselia scalaris TaxID=36166 RepID=T1GGH2_MEGSC